MRVMQSKFHWTCTIGQVTDHNTDPYCHLYCPLPGSCDVFLFSEGPTHHESHIIIWYCHVYSSFSWDLHKKMCLTSIDQINAWITWMTLFNTDCHITLLENFASSKKSFAAVYEIGQVLPTDCCAPSCHVFIRQSWVLCIWCLTDTFEDGLGKMEKSKVVLCLVCGSSYDCHHWMLSVCCSRVKV